MCNRRDLPVCGFQTEHGQPRGEHKEDTSKNNDESINAPAPAQDMSKTNITDALPPTNSTERDKVKLKWPLPPTSIHDGLLFRKVG
jgi:hypothetical protein